MTDTDTDTTQTTTPTVAPCPDWCEHASRCEWETDKETGLPERFHERAFGPYVFITQRERVAPLQPIMLGEPAVRLSISEYQEHSLADLREMAAQLTAAVTEVEQIMASS